MLDQSDVSSSLFDDVDSDDGDSAEPDSISIDGKGEVVSSELLSIEFLSSVFEEHVIQDLMLLLDSELIENEVDEVVGERVGEHEQKSGSSETHKGATRFDSTSESDSKDCNRAGQIMEE